jgi:XTP/dITP diphosphohydrolase
MERLIILASGNPHKVEEMRELAAAEGGPAVRIESAAFCGGMPAVIESAGTFEGNARLKARALRARAPRDAWVLADDSGLCVDALGGAPGVESAYYAGPQGDSAANLRKLIRVMKEVPEGSRGAHFVCVLVLIAPDGSEQVFEGRCDGRLRCEPAGGGGFGYDPLFVPEGEKLTFAELPAATKNRLSHRARAWKILAADIR